MHHVVHHVHAGAPPPDKVQPPGGKPTADVVQAPRCAATTPGMKRGRDGKPTGSSIGKAALKKMPPETNYKERSKLVRQHSLKPTEKKKQPEPDVATIINNSHTWPPKFRRVVCFNSPDFT